jgi:hypothetical protein
MSIHRTALLGIAALAAATFFATAAGVRGQSMSMPAQPSHSMPMADRINGMKRMTKAEKIANAMSAAPATISKTATILDWPAKDGEAPPVLRQGNNGWTCLPDMPDTKGNDPMCLDESWMKWTEAYLAHQPPMIQHVGIGYMMAPGGAWASNSDPYGMAESKDNHWGFHGPHVMIVVPDVQALNGLPMNPATGGAYVMYAGTPYAHIMAPTTGQTMSMHGH